MATKYTLSTLTSLRALAIRRSRHSHSTALCSVRPHTQSTPPRLLPQQTSPRLLLQRTPPTLLPHRRWNSNSQPTHPAPSSTSPAAAKSEDTATQVKEQGGIKSWDYEDILALTSSPSPKTILIDVREPHETIHGTIPTAKLLPLTSNPDGLFLPPGEFLERFGWEKPGVGAGVVFYCKAGVRSRTAARMARGAGWGEGSVKEGEGEGGVGEYAGSWDEWKGRGGGVGG